MNRDDEMSGTASAVAADAVADARAARSAELTSLNDDYTAKYGFHDPEDYFLKAPKGLNHEVVEMISRKKNEPDWMRAVRHAALDTFRAKPMPRWGDTEGLNGIDFENIHYYIKPQGEQASDWNDVPEQIKKTFDRLGIPEAERKFLAGVTAQYESEVVYHSIREDLTKLGVLFMDMDSALREHPEIVRKWFGKIIPTNDNKFSALNTAVWSGGSFIYVPKGVKVDIPLQAYFRINAENMGQFERTLIIADEDSSVHYIEGCTAPTYSSDSLHSAVVELVAMDRARIRYTTIQNWSTNVYNLVTKRAHAHTDAVVEWVDGNLGSKLTMKYPAIVLLGERAHGEVLSIAFAEYDQSHRQQVDQQGQGPQQLPRPGQGQPRRARLQDERRVRCAADRRARRLRHLPDDGRRRVRRARRARGPRLEGWRGAAVLPAEPRPGPGQGAPDDRQRLHRALREGTADGVRRRVEPADRAGDGGIRWLTRLLP
jgi:FeS assembly protein SufB